MELKDVILESLMSFRSFERSLLLRLEKEWKSITPAISYEEFLALYITENTQGPTQQELAGKATFDKTFVKRLVDRMEAKGLMVRFRDTDDRRANRLVVTRLGREVLLKAEKIFTELIGKSRTEDLIAQSLKDGIEKTDALRSIL